MSRIVLLVVAVAFTAMLAVFTLMDLIRHGLNVINLLSIIVVVLFATGVVGALTQRPPPRP